MTINSCIILHNRLFERFDIYDASGTCVWTSKSDKLHNLYDCFFEVRNEGMKEVPVNSREGQRILARIGSIK